MGEQGPGARRVARNTIVQAGADVIGKLASLAFYVVLARSLGDEGFGAFTFSAAAAFVFVSLASFGTDYIVTREVAQDETRLLPLVASATAIKLVFGILGSACALAFASLAGYEGAVLIAVGVMCLATLLELLTKTFSAVFRGVQDALPVGIAIVIQRVSTAAVAVPLLALGAGIVTAAALYLLGAVLAFAWMLRASARRGFLAAPRIDPGHMRWLLIIAIPIGLNEIFGVVMSRVDVGILALLENDSAVGLYGSGYRLFETTLFLSWAFGMAALPAFSVLSRVTIPTIATALELGLKVTAMALFPVGMLMGVFAPLIVSTVYGPEFEGAVPVVRWLSVAAATYGFFSLPSYLLVAQGRQRPLAWVSGTAVVVNICLNLVLIPRHGVTGAAIAMTASQLVLSVVMSYFAIKNAGRISASNIVLGPLAGCGAIAALGALLGQNFPALLTGTVAYFAVALLVERVINPGELTGAIGLLRRGRDVSAKPESPQSGPVPLTDVGPRDDRATGEVDGTS